MRVNGRAAIVTGAGSGIGEGIAKALARVGARVCVAEFVPANMDRVVAEIREAGGEAIGVRTDVADAASAQSMVDAVVDAWGTVDILVNNAGVLTQEHEATDLDEADWDRVHRVNLKGPFLCARAAARVMKARRYGRIVNIISRSWLGSAGLTHYSASKGGVMSFTRSLALELGKYDITVNGVSPGLVLTAMHYTMTPEEQERTLEKARRKPIGRVSTPDDIAYAVLFFASDDAGMITGQNLYVTGGVEITGSGIL